MSTIVAVSCSRFMDVPNQGGCRIWLVDRYWTMDVEYGQWEKKEWCIRDKLNGRL